MASARAWLCFGVVLHKERFEQYLGEHGSEAGPGLHFQDGQPVDGVVFLRTSHDDDPVVVIAAAKSVTCAPHYRPVLARVSAQACEHEPEFGRMVDDYVRRFSLSGCVDRSLASKAEWLLASGVG